MSFMGQKEQGYSNVEFEDLMRCIPEKYRTILVLYYAEGYNSREIAMRISQVLKKCGFCKRVSD